MSRILVSGLSNVETSCAVNAFPVEYQPIDYNFFGISSLASGVGLNVSLALTALGDTVSFLSFAGDDGAGALVRAAAERIADCRFAVCEQTPQSVVLYDNEGRRRVYTDLKDIQERRLEESAYADIADFDGFCLCNINFSRTLLHAALLTDKPIFCDVHCVSDVFDGYNADFMSAADVLFLSNESIMGREKAFVGMLKETYGCKIIVVGMGGRGALLYERAQDRYTEVPAVQTRPVVNTVGAGDALFSAFVHFYLRGEEPVDALKKATVFASYKIGESGASKGFLTEEALQKYLSIG